MANLQGLFDGTFEATPEIEPKTRVKKERVPKPPKIAPVYSLPREEYLTRKAELEARDGVERKPVILCPHCGRPM